MKLLPFTFKASKLACARPGAVYSSAEQKEELRKLKRRADTFDGSRIIFGAGNMAMIFGMGALVVLGRADRIDAGIIIIALVFACLSFKKELAAWQLKRQIDRVESSGGNTPEEIRQLADSCLHACRVIWRCGVLVEDVTDRSNAYVNRVESGQEPRFDGDDTERNDITTRLLRLQSLDTSVHRLYVLNEQAKHGSATKSRYQAFVELLDGLDTIDMSVLNDLSSWRSSLLARRPELNTPS